MKYFGAIKLAIFVALVTFVCVNLFGWSFLISAVFAFFTLAVWFVVTHVKIIRVNQPVTSSFSLSDLTNLTLPPRYFWHGAEGQFYTTTLPEGEALLNRMKDIDIDSWIATDLFEEIDKVDNK